MVSETGAADEAVLMTTGGTSGSGPGGGRYGPLWCSARPGIASECCGGGGGGTGGGDNNGGGGRTMGGSGLPAPAVDMTAVLDIGGRGPALLGARCGWRAGWGCRRLRDLSLDSSWDSGSGIGPEMKQTKQYVTDCYKLGVYENNTSYHENEMLEACPSPCLFHTTSYNFRQLKQNDSELLCAQTWVRCHPAGV